MPYYSQSEIAKALETYHDLRSVSRTIQKIGYPTRARLYTWIHEEGLNKTRKTKYNYKNTPDHPRNPSANVKLEAIRRCFENCEKVADVAEEIGYTTASIYNWRRLFLSKGVLALQNCRRENPRGPLIEGNVDSTSAEVSALNKEVQDLKMEVAILKEALNILKNDPGVDVSALKNKEKTEIANALKRHFDINQLIAKLELPRSVFYYNVKHMNDKTLKEQEHLEIIREVFQKSKKRYGYRRIHRELAKCGKTLSEKVIRRVKRKNGLEVYHPQKRKYSSYKGEITPAVPNRINRDFHANRPNEKWLTDINEFALTDGKLYLSPMIDCFDGKPVYWTIGENPNANLVNRMLDGAIAQLRDGEKPIVHTDRGCHYRWPGWIERMRTAELTRSMSKKGCSPDNSACEGFFGILKNELFYNRDLTGITRKEFKKELNEYMEWFCKDRIKMSLGGMSPVDYRKSLNLLS